MWVPVRVPDCEACTFPQRVGRVGQLGSMRMKMRMRMKVCLGPLEQRMMWSVQQPPGKLRHPIQLSQMQQCQFRFQWVRCCFQWGMVPMKREEHRPMMG